MTIFYNRLIINWAIIMETEKCGLELPIITKSPRIMMDTVKLCIEQRIMIVLKKWSNLFLK
jgi:hypothetical protein